MESKASRRDVSRVQNLKVQYRGLYQLLYGRRRVLDGKSLDQNPVVAATHAVP